MTDHNFDFSLFYGYYFGWASLKAYREDRMEISQGGVFDVIFDRGVMRVDWRDNSGSTRTTVFERANWEPKLVSDTVFRLERRHVDSPGSSDLPEKEAAVYTFEFSSRVCRS